jgi:hypothetical protein
MSLREDVAAGTLHARATLRPAGAPDASDTYTRRSLVLGAGGLLAGAALALLHALAGAHA